MTMTLTLSAAALEGLTATLSKEMNPAWNIKVSNNTCLPQR